MAASSSQRATNQIPSLMAKAAPGAPTARSPKALATEGAAEQRRQKKRAEALLALIARRKLSIVEDFYDIGEALREILDHSLYAALGFASFAALLDAHDVMSDRQARKLIGITRQLTREQALAFGQEKADALIAYAAATPAPDSARFLLEDSATINGVPLAETSANEIKRAAKSVRAEAERARPASPEERALARSRREALRAVKANIARWKLRGVTTELHGDEVVVRLPLKAALKLAKE